MIFESIVQIIKENIKLHKMGFVKDQPGILNQYLNEKEILDKKNNVIGVNPFIHVDLPEGNFSQQWQWKFDSKMTYRDNKKQTLIPK